MEKTIKCKKLEVVYEENVNNLSNNFSKSINIGDKNDLHIIIEQKEKRVITITSDDEKTVFELNTVFTKLERLIMIFEGCFHPIYSYVFSDSSDSNLGNLAIASDNLIKQRLAYFNSSDFCKYHNRLLNIEKSLTAEIYNKWCELLEELDIVHQMYLYSLYENKQPKDLTCAFLIEITQPLVEIVKKEKKCFVNLKPGEDGTILRNCILALFKKYGKDIFEKERHGFYNEVIQILVNSRNRIMHIKRYNNGLYLNGQESLLYTIKISLLYRRIIIDLLGIDYRLYKAELINNVNYYEKLNNTLVKMFLRIKKLKENQK